MANMTFKTNLLPQTDKGYELGSSTLGWKITKINLPTTSKGSVYGPGSAGQVLTSSGSSVYWGDITNSSDLEFSNNILSLKDNEGNVLDSVSFGALASVDAVSGTYTPAGSISQAAIHISPKTTSVSKVKTAGNVSTLTTSVSNEVLSFNFNGGAMPTFDTITVWNGYNTGITNSYVETQTFTGTEATITLSPVTGGAQNGDNVHF